MAGPSAGISWHPRRAARSTGGCCDTPGRSDRSTALPTMARRRPRASARREPAEQPAHARRHRRRRGQDRHRAQSAAAAGPQPPRPRRRPPLLAAGARRPPAPGPGHRRRRGRGGRARRPPTREVAGRAPPCWWVRPCSAGTTTSSTGTARPRATTPGSASRSPTGRLDPGDACWFALACAALLLVPLSVANGVDGRHAPTWSPWSVGLLGNLVLRRGPLSWLPWAVVVRPVPGVPVLRRAGAARPSATRRRSSMTVLAALLGVGVARPRAPVGPGGRATPTAGRTCCRCAWASTLGRRRLLLAAALGRRRWWWPLALRHRRASA